MIFTLQVPLKKKRVWKLEGECLWQVWHEVLEQSTAGQFCFSLLLKPGRPWCASLSPVLLLETQGFVSHENANIFGGSVGQLQLRDNFKLLVVRCQDPWDMETSAFWLRLKVGGHVPECLRGCFGGREKAHRNKHPLLQANVLGPL